MIRRILMMLAIASISLFGNSVANYVKQYEKMTKSQKELMSRIYEEGLKQGGDRLAVYGVAIAFKESNMGKHNANNHDGKGLQYRGSYGPCAALLNTVMNKNKQKNIHASPSEVKNRLMYDKHYAINNMYEDIKMWKKVAAKKGYDDTLKSAMAHYNAGYIGAKSKAGYAYMQDTQKRAIAFQVYMQNNNIG